MFSLKPKYKMWRVFDQPIGTFLSIFLCVVRILHSITIYRVDPCCRSVIKEFAHAFSCAYIELWIHLASLKNTQKARVALRSASSILHIFRALQTSHVHP